jgi:hypothetical protein
METVYIQFEAPHNEQKTKGESLFKRSIKSFTINLISKIIPKANPGSENKLDDVKYWLVECDLNNGIPQREVGLDEQRRVLVKMPFKNNYGYWTDNNLLLNDFKEHFKVSEITKEIFEQQWDLFESE